ncbi:hypothetical protein G5V58_16540 [Nocardioides anomalus]|uniref:Uncharacterized protein n=1 Tax=Nocardioides anomalus TaxID=2712223 RepID=A0A6G6WGE9_9ACTN|nr:DUF5956 family protein [Nocardioides anomalus]QIG44165.1 hypothetical protein G5V58_16540 [Nocardioides anomalus]
MDPWDGGEALSLSESHPGVGVVTDDVEELPEVREARARGWEPVSEAPLWCFLPAVWPRAHRAWTPDRRIRHSTYSSSDGTTGRTPWSAWTYADVEASQNAILAECGFPPRPFGRLWFVRMAGPWPSVDGFLSDLLRDWAVHHDVLADSELADFTRSRVRQAFSV